MLRAQKIWTFSLVVMIFTGSGVFAVDTLNLVDENNMKQGRWVYTNKMKNLPNYKENQVVEEGSYNNDKKIGKWLFYFNNDKVKHVLTYKNNRPDGHAVFYYKNGNKREEGIWKNNKWVGEYNYYYKNGNVRHAWKYNDNGQRTGVQKYFYENGQLKIEGEWVNGKEAGTITEYHEDGSVKSERAFDNGKIDLVATKHFKPQEKAGKVTVKKVEEATVVKEEKKEEKEAKSLAVNTQPKLAVVTIKPEVKKNNITWNGTGSRQFFNKKGQVIREGYFQKGYLMDGKVFMYTSDGKKFRTTEYKGGRVVREINHRKK